MSKSKNLSKYFQQLADLTMNTWHVVSTASTFILVALNIIWTVRLSHYMRKNGIQFRRFNMHSSLMVYFMLRASIGTTKLISTVTLYRLPELIYLCNMFTGLEVSIWPFTVCFQQIFLGSLAYDISNERTPWTIAFVLDLKKVFIITIRSKTIYLILFIILPVLSLIYQYLEMVWLMMSDAQIGKYENNICINNIPEFAYFTECILSLIMKALSAGYIYYAIRRNRDAYKWSKYLLGILLFLTVITFITSVLYLITRSDLVELLDEFKVPMFMYLVCYHPCLNI